MEFDFLIIGAGLSGVVLAERIVTQLNKKVLIIEKRSHIGGNCYDYKDENGIFIHKYGPHIFHTDRKEVFEYLSKFTKWRKYEHKVLAFVDGKKIPIPFNFNSIEMIFKPELAKKLQKKLLSYYEFNSKVSILELINHKDEDIQFLAKYVYNKIFLNYTLKQWSKKPEEMDLSVTARVPIFVGRDNRYFNDKYQVIPKKGYTEMFNNMLDNEKIEIRLNTDFKDIGYLRGGKIYIFGKEFKGKLIYTGSIDELFGYKCGKLKYRTLDLEFETLNKEYFQEAAVVNYPNNYNFTRITEFKHIHPIKTDETVILKEYPRDYSSDRDIRFYPFFTEDSKKEYFLYKIYSNQYKNLILVGRLAEYKYYAMNDIVARALLSF
jgi:UDP-galactopyranose mutase